MPGPHNYREPHKSYPVPVGVNSITEAVPTRSRPILDEAEGLNSAIASLENTIDRFSEKLAPFMRLPVPRTPPNPAEKRECSALLNRIIQMKEQVQQIDSWVDAISAQIDA